MRNFLLIISCIILAKNIATAQNIKEVDFEISNPYFNSDNPIPYGAEDVDLNLLITNLGPDDLDETYTIRYNSEVGFSMILEGGLLVNESKPLYYVTIDNYVLNDTAIPFCAWIVSDLDTTLPEFRYIDTNQDNDSICVEIYYQGANSVGINDLQVDPFIIYPNPINKNASFFIKGNDLIQIEGSLTILDISGRQIMQKNFTFNKEPQEHVLPNNMQSGMYYFIIQDKEGNRLFQKTILIE